MLSRGQESESLSLTSNVSHDIYPCPNLFSPILWNLLDSSTSLLGERFKEVPLHPPFSKIVSSNQIAVLRQTIICAHHFAKNLIRLLGQGGCSCLWLGMIADSYTNDLVHQLLQISTTYRCVVDIPPSPTSFTFGTYHSPVSALLPFWSSRLVI